MWKYPIILLRIQEEIPHHRPNGSNGFQDEHMFTTSSQMKGNEKPILRKVFQLYFGQKTDYFL